MPSTLFWLQCGACGGDSMALLGSAAPDLIALLRLLEIEVLWHPSFSDASPARHSKLVEALLSGEQPLDILCVEGAVIQGPDGTGLYDSVRGKPKRDLVAGLAARARFVVAVGTCASYGGVAAAGETQATGLQFHRASPGGFLGEAFRTRSGLPVLNLPGCPCHGEVLAGALTALVSGVPLQQNAFGAPLQWFGMLVHQGCTRNEYHEFRVEERDFGDRGCLFFHMGCRGPLTYGPCNKLLWNQRNSNSRAGVPCHGCTRPDFPQPSAFFRTRDVAGVPLELPDGVSRAHYLAYKGMAAAAAPQRLQQRATRL